MHTKVLVLIITVLLVGAAFAPGAARAQTPVVAGPNVGTWWGIARSCTTPSRFTQPANTVNQSICRDACGGALCPATTFPIDEVAMMPEFFADGNMVATDHATLVDGHPIGQGRWEAGGTAVIDGKTYQKFQASFMWFQPHEPKDVDPRNPWSIFAGMARPRFVMFYDPDKPNEMIGWLQPFLISLTDRYGLVNLQPNTPFASPDPTAPLPAACDPTQATNPYCFGTFMFVVRRLGTR